MLTFQGSYLIRCWRHDDQICRIEIVHVQSGTRNLVHSVAAALAWIGAHKPDGSVTGPERR